ncbi:interferon-induced protein 44-like [Pygocentrus nattereri]|uniref:Ig-like domain-containing protein n=1 Tax=Pygocentrus nattereri TaxID=42514 RepID=A0A3B4DSY5_PYGNA|nr:interferon-induced protein 44-like [Pygocentrus nattereri]
MGFSQSKPEFATVLADKHVKIGEDIILHCEAKTGGLTGTWEKNKQKLDCVEDKTFMTQTGRSFLLKIRNAEEGDEGNYTLILRNKSDRTSCSAMVTVEQNEWRRVEWNQDGVIDALKTFEISNEKVDTLRFLLYGPIGAGKSSTINTIKTVFEGRLFINCLAASQKTPSSSQSLYYEKFEIRKDGLLPFAFNDFKGLEKEDTGVHAKDIISALKGHMKEGYLFNPKIPLPENSQYYLRDPGLNDQIHCLVNVIPADTISMIKDDYIKKMKEVREAASIMGIPQVVFMTRVDCACPMTKKDLRSIYKSRKIREKMQECSIELGVPENCIFPVWNYHKETEIKEEINCLMLHALTKIVHFADDYIVKRSNRETSLEK